MSSIFLVLSFQGRSRRNARRQLEVIRRERADAVAAQTSLAVSRTGGMGVDLVGHDQLPPSNPHPAVGTRPAAQAWSGPQDALRLAFSALVVVTLNWSA